MFKSTKGTHRGFTLIELLVVIAIIGVLTSIILPDLNSARAKSRDARRITDIKQIQLALETYAEQNAGQYPADIYATSGSIAPEYIATVPKDPSSNVDYTYVPVGTAANACYGYHLGASLETNDNSLQSDADSAPAGVGNTCGVTIGTGDLLIDFNGTSAAAGGQQCSNTAGTPQPGGTETCYDVTN